MSNKNSFDAYQETAAETAVFPRKSQLETLMYLGLGLTGESGESAEKIKKLYRDYNGVITEEFRDNLIKELGDIIWYASQIALELGVNFSEVAERNIEKLQSRMKQNKIQGSGDNRENQ